MSKRILLLFAFSYMLTMLVTAPASLLDLALKSATGGKFVLANASGTIWDGAAIPALRTRDGQLISLSLLHWKMVIPALLSGKVKVLLQWEDQPAAMEVIASVKQIELHNAKLALPALLLGETSSMLKPIQLHGQLQIAGENLLFSTRGMEGSAIIDWQNAGSALTGSNTLGFYRLKLDGASEHIHIVLSTTSGMLLLEGEGDWSIVKGLKFSGKAQASNGNYDNLSELLHHLGPEISKGVHAFNFVPQ